MCRLLAYAGPPIFLASLLTEPRSSLIAQSMAARQARTAVNGDGSGIGWYGEHSDPGLYRSIVPAWSDANLVSLCRQIRSPLFMAHVRAATGGEVSTANCHPFTDGRSLFIHNGQIGDYGRLRRKIEALIADDVYPLRQGSTDSEAIFLAACSAGLGENPAGAFAGTLARIAAIRDLSRPVAARGSKRMATPLAHQPVASATRQTSNAAAPATAASSDQALEHPSPCEADESGAIRFAAVHVDGSRLTAYRWADDGRPPSLYWRRIGDATAQGTVIASEPCDEGAEGWNRVPPSSMLTAWPDGRMTLAPFEPVLAERTTPRHGGTRSTLNAG